MAEPSEERIDISDSLQFAADIRTIAVTPPSGNSEAIIETATALEQTLRIASEWGTLDQIAIDIPENAFLRIEHLVLKWEHHLLPPSYSPGPEARQTFFNRPIGTTGLYLQVSGQAPTAAMARLREPHTGRIIGSDHLSGTRINPDIQIQGRARSFKL